jgi:hypothetical protein
MRRRHRFPELPGSVRLQGLGREELEQLEDVLRRAVCADRLEEFRVVLSFLMDGGPDRRYERRAVDLLKKFTHRKYRLQWREEAKRVEEMLRGAPGRYPQLERGFQELRRLASLRFNG